IQTKYKKAAKDYDKVILPILKANAKIANEIANKKLNQVYKAIGIK
ncbi:MAG: tryptophan--tRNA ligase, partial [Malacoplasma sp.]|nr:tryptophan--tRNA ligase [Malacoplasma sp.]